MIKAQETMIYNRLFEELSGLAKKIIKKCPENANFVENPDDAEEHEVNWHQFGIITHTQKFIRFFQNEAWKYFKEWSVDEKIDRKLAEMIDGRTRTELLLISIVLHDIGKFGRGFKMKNGRTDPDYKGHEAYSEVLVRENAEVNGLLKNTYGLTDAQIDYIARCAGLHYELGKIRNEAKKTAGGYTIAFSESEECKISCEKTAREFKEFREEIGILFLCDSLAKTDVRIDARNDAEIQSQTGRIERMVEELKLKKTLVAAIKQGPVNIAVARRYLEGL